MCPKHIDYNNIYKKNDVMNNLSKQMICLFTIYFIVSSYLKFIYKIYL